MSQRAIDDPELAGWELNPDTGYWMWKGEEGTGGGLWEQNGDDIYYEDGKVGIGIDTPLRKLHISEDTGSAFLQITTKDDESSGGILMGSSSNPTVGQVFYEHATDSMYVVTSGEERMTIAADGNTTFSGDVKMSTWYREGYGGLTTGNAGAGVSVMPMFAGSSEDNKTHLGDPTKRFKNGYFGGTVFTDNVTADGDIRSKQNVVAYYSDVRLKDIQGPIENPIEKVKAIETFYYTHGDRARELGYEGSEMQVGVSAQSVQAVAPELIHRAPVDDDGEGGSVTGESYITVDYPRLVPLLIESIKQLSAEIEELKK